MLAHLQGDEAAAMGRVREAVRRAPALGEAHRLLGLLTAEAGVASDAHRSLEAARKLDPRSVLALVDFARTRALEGDCAGAVELLDSAENASPGNAAIAYVRCLTVTWCGPAGDARVERARALAAAAKATGAFAHALRIVAREDELAEVKRLVALVGTKGTTEHQRAWAMKIVAESYATQGDLPEALSALRSAERSGMIDLAWLDKCPSLEPLRVLSGFADVRRKVNERAKAVLTAIRA
jgi:serine/threonine-protein kinase